MQYSRLVNDLRHLRWYERAAEVVPMTGYIRALVTLLQMLPERERTALRMTIIDRDRYQNEPGGGAGAACEALHCEMAEVYRIRRRALSVLDSALQTLHAPERRSPPEGGRGRGEPAAAD